MTQFLLHLPDDVQQAFFQRQIEMLQRGQKLKKGQILIDWIRKGMEAEKKEEGK
jgi:hypothetical protein